jgi:hypothetical protein
MIKSTLALYVDTLMETGGALMRGPFVWLFLLVLPVVITVASVVLSPLGIIGGFIIGFGAVYLYGAYLYAVGQSVSRRNALGFGIIQESMGHHVWDVMGIAFLHWIMSLALQFGALPDVLPTLIALVTFILFNPWPEVIHTERVQGSMDILVRAFRFMQANGPEWVIPHIVLFVCGFGFTMVPGDLAPMMAIGAGVFLHPVMVFRAVLYRKLSSGSRRVRSWQGRF